MALLQISEPGLSTAPHEHRLAVGIDLGTTNSLVAAVRSGLAVVLPDADGSSLLPSIVRYLADGQVIVGPEARKVQGVDPKNTLASIKRFMGRGLKDAQAVENAPYDFVEAEGLLRVKTVAGPRTPVEVSSEILKVLATRAEAALGGPLTGAVITVPAYFDDAQRQATKDAAKLAGIHVLRLLNEPTAAAIAYGLDNASEGTFAVFDLGGGTFDISILRLTRGVFEVLATNGNAMLGGDDFDHRVYCWVLEQAHLAPPGAGDQRLLMMRARAAKEALTTARETTVAATLTSGEEVNLTLDVETFAEITRTLVSRTLAPTRKALKDAGLQPQDVDGVVMVGGATRMPQVQRAVAEFFGREPLTNLDPDKVVALGAAIQANVLAGNKPEGDVWLLLDVIPLSLGIETMGGLVERIIPRNSTIPAARAQEFTTFRDGQTAVGIHVVQGERELVSDCRSLARFELRGVPPMVAGAARVRVTFQVDADGLLSVAAREMHSGVAASVTVKPSYGLTDDEIAGMLKDSYQHAKDDVHARALREQQVEADRIIEATRAALEQDVHLLDESERTAIESAVHVLLEARAGVDHRAIKVAIDRLNKATVDFAGRRMDAGIRRALAGQRIEEIGL